MGSRRLSFAITTRDEDPAILAATVEGLLATTHGHWREIIVVDDGSVLPVDYSHPEVTVLRNNEPIGVCPSRRRALALATGDVFTVLDPHMSFAPDWLDRMLEFVDSRALLCSPWMDYERTVHYAWGVNYNWSSARPGIGHSCRNNRPRAAVTRVPMIMGACYMIRRDAYAHIGGFCPLFRIWGKDEQDMSARAWMSGLEVKCVTRAHVGHLSRMSRNRIGGVYPLFNEIVILRTVFEERTAQLMEEFLGPLPDEVNTWLKDADIDGWRSEVQARRTITDAEFFQRYAPRLPLSFRNGKVNIRRGHTPASRVRAALEIEERDAGLLPAIERDAPPEGALRLQGGVIEWRGRTLVFIGDELSGVRSLIGHFVAAGAICRCDSFADFDSHDRVHGRAVDYMVVARYRMGSRQARVRHLAGAKALLALTGSVLSSRANEAFPLFTRSVRSVPVLEATGGSVLRMYDLLIDALTRP
ncbi:MAG: glycosyltransferase [Acidobacteriaceae bacterium]|nr:glycosyltransferase [Acidobacteriaceae bacterium]